LGIEVITIALFGGMIIMLALGIPVVWGLGGLTVLLTVLTFGTVGLYTVATTAFREITDEALITIPLFILMGQFLLHSGIADRLFQSVSYWLSGVRGGLALVAVAVSVVLAMCGGFGPGLITMGLIAVPAMLKRGYDKNLALGSVMAGGVLGVLVPPSVMMIIFAYIAHLSLGRLFFGGIFPALLTATLIIVFILILALVKPGLAPRVKETVTWKLRLTSLRSVVVPVLLVLAVLGSIFTGIATPVEASGIGAFGALISCFIYRNFSWKMLHSSIYETLKLTAVVLWLLIAATLFSVYFTSAGAQRMVIDIVQGLDVNRWIILVIMQIILLIMGMFMDDYAIVTVAAPVFMPIAVNLGFDPIWFAIVFITNMQIAYLTPPFGWGLILMKGLAPPEISLGHIWRSVPPYIAIQVVVLVLVILVPPIALWLPGLL
jgi:tripartite ATP-independent transporter DctM subunit